MRSRIDQPLFYTKTYSVINRMAYCANLCADVYSPSVTKLRHVLQHLIEERDTNPTALAAATGVPQPTIHRILSGESKDPRTATLQPLADFFDVSVEFLRTGGTLAEKRGPIGVTGVVSSRLDQVAEAPAPYEIRPLRAAPSRTMVLQEFRDHLSPELHENIENRVNLQDHRYMLDYGSDKVAAELKHLVVDHLPNGRLVVRWQTARPALWRLSSVRLLTKDTLPNRQYILFLIMVGPPETALPVPNLAQLQNEARLHGINVVLADARSAAQCIEGVEAGFIDFADNFDSDDYDEDY